MTDADATWDAVRALEAVYDDLVRRTVAGDLTLAEGRAELRRRLAGAAPEVLAMSWRFQHARRALRLGWADGEWQRA